MSGCVLGREGGDTKNLETSHSSNPLTTRVGGSPPGFVRLVSLRGGRDEGGCRIDPDESRVDPPTLPPRLLPAPPPNTEKPACARSEPLPMSYGLLFGLSVTCTR